MIREINYSLCLIILLLFGGSIRPDITDKNHLNGTVVHQESGKTIEGVHVIVDGKFQAVSDSLGMFRIEGYKLGLRPKELTVIKKGLELASWVHTNNELQIELRDATIKHLKGYVEMANATPLPSVEVKFIGNHILSTLTGKNGEFEFEIPIEQDHISVQKFEVEGYLLRLAVEEENTETATIQVRLIAYDRPEFSGIISLYFRESEGKSVEQLVVIIDDQYYSTDKNGLLQVPGNSALYDINVKGYKLLAVDTLNAPNSIAFTIQRIIPDELIQEETFTKGNASYDALAQEFDFLRTDSLIRYQTEMAVSKGIDSTKIFFKDQKGKLIKQNQFITSLKDSVLQLSEISHLDHEHLLIQLGELNKSIHQSEEAFNITKEASSELILKLRNILEHKDQKIKDIQEEKDALSRMNRDNILTFTWVSLTLILMLVLSHLVNRRFKKQKKVIEKTKEQLLEAQELAKVTNMIYDYKTKAFTYSENFFKTLGISAAFRKKAIQKITGEQFPVELIDEKDRSKVLSSWKSLLATQEPMHIRFKGKADDDTLYIDMNSQLDFDASGKKVSISSSLQNVTEQIENELRLVGTLKELENTSKAKEHFMASMSHEIRTPLNAIIGLTTHLMSQKYLAAQLENLKAIQFSSSHLLSLVNDMLDFSRIRAGKLKLDIEVFDLIDLIHGLIKSMSNQASEKGLQLTEAISIELPRFLEGDQLRITQVLMNLIGNGIKFTDEGSISLEVKLEQKSANVAHIGFFVRDTGIGISEDRLDRVFEGFEQESVSTARKYGGSGLGLAISKELVHMMGGELRAKSESNVGSEFYFVIPLKIVQGKEKNDSNKGSVQKEIRESLKGMRIFCVEDNKINQLVLSQYFNKWKVIVQYAENGSEALEKFDPDQFDLVLMDIRLPDIDGYEVTRKILEKYPNCPIPIIALTAEVNEHAEEKFLKAGMSGFLPKPFKEEQLISALKRIEKNKEKN